MSPLASLLSALQWTDQVDRVPDTFLPLASNLQVKLITQLTPDPGLTSMLASLESSIRKVAAVSSKLYFFMKFLVDLWRGSLGGGSPRTTLT